MAMPTTMGIQLRCAEWRIMMEQTAGRRQLTRVNCNFGKVVDQLKLVEGEPLLVGGVLLVEDLSG